MKPQHLKLNKLHLEHKMKEKMTRFLEFIPNASTERSGIMSFIRPAWVKLNRSRTGVRYFRSNMHK